MSTASTRRRGRKKGDAWGGQESAPEAARPVREPSAPAPEAAAPADIPERAWMIASLLVLAAAALLRLYALGLKPMHHDEGVNGFFLTTLVREGSYRYNPENYHGPTLYYLSLPPVALFGLSTFAVRSLTALFGVATVGLVLALRRRLGSVAALAGAALVAVSPACVYYSRYYIHETLFVFFTLGIVVAAVRFYETGTAWHMMLLSLSAAMLFATKETAFISLATLGLAWVVARAWAWAWAKRDAPAAPTPSREKRRAKPVRASGWEAFVARAGGANRLALLVAGGLTLFLVVNVLFYSSFFTYRAGISGAIESLDVWTKTGTSDFHKKPAYTYVGWLWQEEAPILILASVGAAAALFGRAKNRAAVFTGAWAFGMLAAYSLIPYKTPWLVLSFVVPMCVVGGYGVQALSRLAAGRSGLMWLGLFLAAAFAGGLLVTWLGDEARPGVASEALGVGPAALQAALVVLLVAALTCVGAYLARAYEGRAAGLTRTAAAALVVAGLACAVSAYQAWAVNFREYDNDRYPYVYSHTQRELLDLIAEVERLAEREGRGREAGVSVASPEYWPLPWYWRDYKAVGYHGSVSARYDAQATPIVIGRASDNSSEDQVDKLRAALGPDYQQVGTYALRPGVRLALFARRDLVRDL
ncbi:MAG TPA: flippase activity-associated protein Agl23 [Pyrinomonadaceae bacterium]|nr:flippase activity-associated protein Agl23 [Pyrinomonadaceae bacterium]